MMDYATFFARFGASARTKHILGSAASSGDLGKRAFALPATSEMPAEFIRLCPWEGEYLFSVAARARTGILETGRFNGGSLFVMACAAPDGVPIWSIDKKPRDDVFLRERLDRFCPAKTIDLIVGDSQQSKYPQIGEIDLLFIDGDHRYEGCLADITNWYANLVPGGHLVFHDSYEGPYGVQQAILDFMRDHSELEVVLSPKVGADHWHYPAGSIAHLIKQPAPSS
jgi:predicted O-methyltransferase YrrM